MCCKCVFVLVGQVRLLLVIKVSRLEAEADKWPEEEAEVSGGEREGSRT